MENINSSKFYSRNQIDIATFIGGPLIAGYLISQNYKAFGNTEASKKATMISIFATLGLIISFILIDRLGIAVPDIAPSIIPIIVAHFVVTSYQSKQIEEYKKLGNSQASSWGVLGKSIISLIIMSILILVMYAVAGLF